MMMNCTCPASLTGLEVARDCPMHGDVLTVSGLRTQPATFDEYAAATREATVRVGMAVAGLAMAPVTHQGAATLRPVANPSVSLPGPESEPMGLLLASTTLIPDQPTTEQWQIIKNAIRSLIPGPGNL